MRIFIPAALLMLATVSAHAENSFSVEGQCAKSDPQHTLAIPDAPGHAFIVAKLHCTLSGGEVNGLALKQQDIYASTETHGVDISDRGHVIVTAEGGDKAFITYQGKSAMHDKIGYAAGTWRFTGGTGKLKGLEGKGTYKATVKPDGTSTEQIEGNWNIHQSVAQKIRATISK